MPKIRLALAQINPTVGDLEGNCALIVAAARRAHEAGADLMACGEMAVSGYPIEDLAQRSSFLAACRERVHQLARELFAEGLGDIPVIVGHPDGPFSAKQAEATAPHLPIAQNVASVLHNGAVVGRYAKHHLPNYSVFDEYRNFIPGDDVVVLRIRGIDVGLLICEDIWCDGWPLTQVSAANIGILVVINGSPFHHDKDEVRLPLIQKRARELHASVAYVNLVGGQDDLVFDGDSIVVDEKGEICARAPQFSSHLLIADCAAPAAENLRAFEQKGVHRVVCEPPSNSHFLECEPDISQPMTGHEQIWNALTLSLTDYVEKNGFSSVILGLSGGIDSALCATIATDALGSGSVYGVSMPSRWSSEHSQSDALDLAKRLGCHYEVQPIADLVDPCEKQLKLDGVAAENLQARIRGIILMSLSNKRGHLVLTTGNKSELAVGYSTIYGDSVGGFAPLKDVPKTLVWELARWRNDRAISRGEHAPIPENSLNKPPSAELKPGQLDQDFLPEYSLLDAILSEYIDNGHSSAEIVQQGYPAETVEKIIKLVDRSEWKRRQSAVGPKISTMAFGRDRRLPITYRTADAPTPPKNMHSLA